MLSPASPKDHVLCLPWFASIIVCQTLLLLTVHLPVNSVYMGFKGLPRFCCRQQTQFHTDTEQCAFPHPHPTPNLADLRHGKHVTSLLLLLMQATHTHMHTYRHLMTSGHTLDLQGANNTHTYSVLKALNNFRYLTVHFIPRKKVGHV